MTRIKFSRKSSRKSCTEEFRGVLIKAKLISDRYVGSIYIMFYESCSKCIHKRYTKLTVCILSWVFFTFLSYIRLHFELECSSGLHKRQKCICVFACVKNYIIYSNQSHYIARNWYYKRTTGLFSKRPKRKMGFYYFSLQLHILFYFWRLFDSVGTSYIRFHDLGTLGKETSSVRHEDLTH